MSAPHHDRASPTRSSPSAVALFVMAWIGMIVSLIVLIGVWQGVPRTVLAGVGLIALATVAVCASPSMRDER